MANTTVDFYVSAGADDGYCWGVKSINTNSTTIPISVMGDNFFRFTNVTIPSGATIESAYLQLTIYDYPASNMLIKYYANNVANAVAPTTVTEFNNLVKTSAYIDYNVDFDSIDEYVVATDLKTVIQSVINLSGWTSGNALMFISHVTTSGGFSIYSYDFGVSSSFPKLHIVYSTPGTNVTVDALSCTASAASKILVLNTGATVTSPLSICNTVMKFPTIGGGVNVQPTALTAGGICNAPEVSCGYGSPVMAATAIMNSVITSTVRNISIVVSVSTASVLAKVPSISCGVGIVGIKATASANTIAPIINAIRNTTVTATKIIASANMINPVINTMRNIIISIPSTSASATSRSPLISLGVKIIGIKATASANIIAPIVNISVHTVIAEVISYIQSLHDSTLELKNNYTITSTLETGQSVSVEIKEKQLSYSNLIKNYFAEVDVDSSENIITNY